MWKKHLLSIWYEKNYIYIYSNYKNVKWNWNGHSSLCLAKMSKFWVSLAMTAVPAAPGCSLLGFGSWNDFLLQPGTMNPWPVEGTNVFPKKMGGPEFSAKSGRSSSSMCFKAVGKIASFFFLGKTTKHTDITFKLFVTHHSHPIVLHPLSLFSPSQTMLCLFRGCNSNWTSSQTNGYCMGKKKKARTRETI